LKVLIINIGPSRSGVGNYVKLILKYGRLDYDVLNVSLSGRRSPADYPSSVEHTSYISISSNPVEGLIKYYFGFMSREITSGAEDMGRDADLIFLSQQDLIGAAALIRKRLGRPVVATIHDVGIFRGKYLLHPYRFFIDSNLRRVNDLSMVFFDSEKTEQDVMRKVDLRVPHRVIELTVDPQLFRPIPRSEAREKLDLPLEGTLLLSVGKDGYVKNIRTVLRSLAFLDNVKLVRVGKLENSLRVYRSLPQDIRERILIREDVPDELLPYYYSAADAFLFPSLAEGFGLELLEAAFCGTPVVTTHAPPMNDIIPVGHFVKDPKDPKKLAEAVRLTLRDRDDILKSYVDLRRRFDVERFIREFESALAEVAGSGG
jgi:glycosyltransferase involved in cell wall biosynthesis